MSSPEGSLATIDRFVSLGHYRKKLETALTENPQLSDSAPITLALQETQHVILALETSVPFIEQLVGQKKRTQREVSLLEKGAQLGIVGPDLIERARKDGVVKEAERIIIFDHKRMGEKTSNPDDAIGISIDFGMSPQSSDESEKKYPGRASARRAIKFTEEFGETVLSTLDDLLDSSSGVSKSRILSFLEEKGIKIGPAGWGWVRRLFSERGVNSFGRTKNLLFSKNSEIVKAIRPSGRPVGESIRREERKFAEKFGKDVFPMMDDLLDAVPVVSKSEIIAALNKRGIKLSPTGWVWLRSLFGGHGINTFGTGSSLRFSKHALIPQAEKESVPTEEGVLLISRMTEFGVDEIRDGRIRLSEQWFTVGAQAELLLYYIFENGSDTSIKTLNDEVFGGKLEPNKIQEILEKLQVLGVIDFAIGTNKDSELKSGHNGKNTLVISDFNREKDEVMEIHNKEFPHLTKTVRGLAGMLWTNDRLKYGATRGLTVRLFPGLTDEFVEKCISRGLISPLLSSGGSVQYFDITSMIKLVCFKKYGDQLADKKQLLEEVVNHELNRFQHAFEEGEFSTPLGDGRFYRKNRR